MRVSKSGRCATALSLYTSQNEDGITVLNPSLKLERFVLDKDGPFAELHKVIEEQHQETKGPPFISNLPDFRQIAQNLVSIMGHQSKTPSGDICKALIQNNIMDISSLSSHVCGLSSGTDMVLINYCSLIRDNNSSIYMQLCYTWFPQVWARPIRASRHQVSY